MRQTINRSRRPATLCEPLENRAYAAKIHYGADYTLFNEVLGFRAGSRPDSHPAGAIQAAVWKHGPASVIRTLEQSRALPRQYVVPYLDKSGTLYLRGSFGDDTIDIRNIGGGKIRINYVSFQNETGRKADLDKLPNPQYRMVPGSSQLAYQTSLTGNTFEVKASDVRHIAIDGGAGDDTVRAKGLLVVPVVAAVEHTPSTAITAQTRQVSFGAVLGMSSSRPAADSRGSGPKLSVTDLLDR